jgi:hypothetical protein
MGRGPDPVVEPAGELRSAHAGGCHVQRLLSRQVDLRPALGFCDQVQVVRCRPCAVGCLERLPTGAALVRIPAGGCAGRDRVCLQRQRDVPVLQRRVPDRRRVVAAGRLGHRPTAGRTALDLGCGGRRRLGHDGLGRRSASRLSRSPAGRPSSLFPSRCRKGSRREADSPISRLAGTTGGGGVVGNGLLCGSDPAVGAVVVAQSAGGLRIAAQPVRSARAADASGGTARQGFDRGRSVRPGGKRRARRTHLSFQPGTVAVVRVDLAELLGPHVSGPSPLDVGDSGGGPGLDAVDLHGLDPAAVGVEQLASVPRPAAGALGDLDGAGRDGRQFRLVRHRMGDPRIPVRAARRGAGRCLDRPAGGRTVLVHGDIVARLCDVPVPCQAVRDRHAGAQSAGGLGTGQSAAFPGAPSALVRAGAGAGESGGRLGDAVDGAAVGILVEGMRRATRCSARWKSTARWPICGRH